MQRMHLLVCTSLALAALQSGCGGSDTPAPVPAAAAPAAVAPAAPVTPAAPAEPAPAPEQPAPVEAAPAAPAPAEAVPSRPRIVAETPEALEAAIIAEWRKLPEAGRDQLDIETALALAAQLKEEGPNGIRPLLDELAEDPGNPLGKMLVVITSTDLIAPTDQARLIELSQPGVETTGRVCAVTLLCMLDSPEAKAQAHLLLEDADRRVRASTVLALLPTEDAKALAKLPEIIKDPDTTSSEKQQIVFSIPDGAKAEYLPFFVEMLSDQSMVENVRQHAAMVLGDLGTKEQLPAMEAAAKADTHPLVRVQIMSAMDGIRAREGMPPLGKEDTLTAPVPTPQQ